MNKIKPSAKDAPEKLSKLKLREREIKSELQEINTQIKTLEKRKSKLLGESNQINRDISDTRDAIDALAHPDKVRSEVAEWKQKIEGKLASINLESVKENPYVVVNFFNSRKRYFEESQKLLKKAKKIEGDDLKNQILATIDDINKKAEEIYEDKRYHQYLEGLSWAR